MIKNFKQLKENLTVKPHWIGIMLCLLMMITACGQKAPTWQEQYDLGVRYLEEGSYEEAIIAFTAAIEIDPKRAEAYVGRGDVYIGLGETEENLAAAQSDYEVAIKLDEANANAYLGLANIYVCRGNLEKALDILREALDRTGNNQMIAEKIEELENKILPSMDADGTAFFETVFSMMQAKDYDGLDMFIWNQVTSASWYIQHCDDYPQLCYDGTVFDSSLTGIGLKAMNGRDWYFGELIEGNPEGIGIYFDPCGGYTESDPAYGTNHYLLFEGSWADGKANGQGTETYFIGDVGGHQNCSITTGTWIEGHENGDMVLTFYTDWPLDDPKYTYHYTCEHGVVTHSDGMYQVGFERSPFMN